MLLSQSSHLQVSMLKFLNQSSESFPTSFPQYQYQVPFIPKCPTSPVPLARLSLKTFYLYHVKANIPTCPLTFRTFPILTPTPSLSYSFILHQFPQCVSREVQCVVKAAAAYLMKFMNASHFVEWLPSNF